MEPLQHIKLSFKCPRQLNQLQSCNGDWYCDGCQKIVHDFRGMTELQIIDAFAKSDYKMCGLFDDGRIELMPQQNRWLKWLPAALLALGAGFIQSCTNSFFPVPDYGASQNPVPAHFTMGAMILPVSEMISPRQAAIQSYLYQALSNPLKLKGMLTVRYVLNVHGYITKVKVLHSKHKTLNAQIIKALEASPQWMPIEVNGIYVKKHFTVDLDLSQIKP